MPNQIMAMVTEHVGGGFHIRHGRVFIGKEGCGLGGTFGLGP